MECSHQQRAAGVHSSMQRLTSFLRPIPAPTAAVCVLRSRVLTASSCSQCVRVSCLTASFSQNCSQCVGTLRTQVLAGKLNNRRGFTERVVTVSTGRIAHAVSAFLYENTVLALRPERLKTIILIL